jgi:hypothetical protein
VTSIDILSDDVLLAIFDFCMDEYQYTKEEIEAWQSLVHVCRRWRNIVFGSPRRLNLRLVIKDKTSVRDMLDVWPPLPLVIYGDPTGVDFSNIVSVLEHRDRVDEIRLWQVYGFALEKLLAVMQEPFPELTDLMLRSYDETAPVVPDSFLGGSAPRLRKLVLVGIPFPGLPNLLLSSAHLVGLYLENIPQTGYISPAAMVTTLSTLTNLESLSLQFQSPRSHPEPASRRLLPSTRSVLPIFTRFSFKGACEYLNDFVAHIVAPRLDELFITLFNDIVFDAPQFIQFISRTPTLKPLETGRIVFEDHAAKINLSSQKSGYGSLEVRISCREFDWQVSSLEQVCTLCLPPLSALEDLCIYQHTLSYPHWKDYIDNTLWVELLQPFTAVKKLYLSKELAPRIVPALQELVGGRTAEVLPALQNILLEELQPSARVQDDIRQFVSMRQAIGHSIVVSLWDRLPTTKSTAWRKPAIACLFCLQRKIACSAPPVGSTDMTCKYVVPLLF